MLSRERALVLVLVAATAVVFYILYLIARPFLSSLAWALALAVLAYPVHQIICRRIRRANVAAAITVALVVVLLGCPAFFVGHQIVRQAGDAAEVIHEQLATGAWRKALAGTWFVPLLDWLETNFDPGTLGERLSGLAQNAGPQLLRSSVWVLAEMLITVFALFYFVRDRRHITAAVRSLAPLSDTEMNEVVARVRDTIRATVFGSLVVAFVQGAMGGLMFWLLGLPAPLVWGAVMGLLAVVPALGTFVVWAPTAVYLALTGSAGKGAILATWGLVAIGLVDNLLYPVLVGSRLRLHPLAIFISVVGGLLLFGGSGLILGPVTFAVALALVDIWERRTVRGRTAERPLQQSDRRAA